MPIKGTAGSMDVDLMVPFIQRCVHLLCHPFLTDLPSGAIPVFPSGRRNSTPQIDPVILREDREHGPFAHPKHRAEHEHRPRSKRDVRPKALHKSKKSKSKGKARATSSDSESDADDARGKTRTGRSSVQNYNKVNKGILFDTVEEVLPTGEKGWKLVKGSYNTKAMSVGRLVWVASSLKAKYQLVHYCLII
jgi:hypothetical protein